MLAALAFVMMLPADFDAGLSLFRDLEYEQALVEFEFVAHDPNVSEDNRARALLWAAVCRGALGDEPAARTGFAEARALAPTLTYPQDAPTKLRPLFDEAAAALPSNAPAAGTGPAMRTPPLAALGLGAGAAVALATTGVLVWLARGSEERSRDSAVFVDEAAAAADAANVQYALAGVTAVAAVACAAGAVAALFIE